MRKSNNNLSHLRKNCIFSLLSVASFKTFLGFPSMKVKPRSTLWPAPWNERTLIIRCALRLSTFIYLAWGTHVRYGSGVEHENFTSGIAKTNNDILKTVLKDPSTVWSTQRDHIWKTFARRTNTVGFWARCEQQHVFKTSLSKARQWKRNWST